MKHTRKICLLASVVMVGCALFDGCGPKDVQEPTTRVELPVAGEKQPSQYTWAEYLAMDDSQKQAFRESFGSDAVFQAWMDAAQREDAGEAELALPWEQGGKQPKDYTWAEFEDLTAELQMAFQNSFGSFEAFDAWLQKNQPVETEPTEEELQLPWEQGGKQPEEYSWAEFEALSGELQMAFQNSFERMETFDAWLEKNMPRETEPEVKLPWENGGKQPEDYTWAEFEALSGEQQMEFQNSFGSFEAFDAWLQQNMPVETEPVMELPWEQGGKQPEDYTWAEFEALSGELQMAFQSSFGSFEEFDAWLQRVNP